MLTVNRINTFYKAAHILFDVSLQIVEGECVGLLGRNGAGKTTTLRSIIGLTPPKEGTIFFKGENITHLPHHLIANRGIGLVPQGRRIFPNLTVEQQIRLAMNKNASRADWDLEAVYQHFPQLKNLRTRKGWNLSGGEQQMLAIARALIRNPDFLLMDEPSEGLAPLIVREVVKIIEDLKKRAITILLVEQNAKMALKISERSYIMNNGGIRYEGKSEKIRMDPELMQKLLGVY